MIDPENSYSQMQRDQYNTEASRWNLGDKNHVIGNFYAHLLYDDYEDLFKDYKTSDKLGLEFGCGPGRNLVRFGRRFAGLHGVDISQVCLDKAREYLEAEGYPVNHFRLCLTNGVDLSEIANHQYDTVFSVICLQHICVHDIRYNLMKEIYRVLRTGGMFTAQMGFGNREGGHEYEENYYEANGTNGWHDVMVRDPRQLQTDLESIGFTNFEYHLTEVRGGDVHDNWIYFRATK